MSTIIDNHAIKRRLERLICREHGEHPKVTITAKGFSANCCCDAFRSEIAKQSKKIVAEETKKSIEKSLSKMFK